ncbi:hypothetical protein L6261_04320 [Candidatus Parcubacteria bacterium]|nr:hypothetical protein [Candidatus Parcubacteria bacterium]
MQYNKEQIKERYNNLPEDVKQAISSVDTTNVVVNIGEKYQLHVDQLGELVDETGLVMLGFTKTNDFVSNLEKRLNVPREKAINLVKEINDEILIKIRESMKKIIDEKREEKSEEIIQPKAFENEIHDREKILREIEFPGEIKSETNKKEEQNNEETKKWAPDTHQNEEEIKNEEPNLTDDQDEVSQEITTPTHTEIIEKKLTEVVKMPVVEKKIIEEEENQPKKENKPAEIKTDPYREPIE